jgi:TetR/AcrR family fatty acid metabolism transcriptional regulator
MRTKSGNKEQAILDAAVLVFAREGYHSARMTKIAEEAGIATGSVYLYFENKEAILHRLFEEMWKSLAADLAAVTERADLSHTEKFDAMIDLLFDAFESDPALAIVFVNDQQHLARGGTGEFAEYYGRFLDLGEKVIRDGMKKGEFNRKVDVVILRTFLFGGMRHLIHQWAQHPDVFPLTVLRKESKYFLKHGLLGASSR